MGIRDWQGKGAFIRVPNPQSLIPSTANHLQAKHTRCVPIRSRLVPRQGWSAGVEMCRAEQRRRHGEGGPTGAGRTCQEGGRRRDFRTIESLPGSIVCGRGGRESTVAATRGPASRRERGAAAVGDRQRTRQQRTRQRRTRSVRRPVRPAGRHGHRQGAGPRSSKVQGRTTRAATAGSCCGQVSNDAAGSGRSGGETPDSARRAMAERRRHGPSMDAAGRGPARSYPVGPRSADLHAADESTRPIRRRCATPASAPAVSVRRACRAARPPARPEWPGTYRCAHPRRRPADRCRTRRPAATWSGRSPIRSIRRSGWCT